MIYGKTFQAWFSHDRCTMRFRTVYRIGNRIMIPLSKWHTTTSEPTNPLLVIEYPTLDADRPHRQHSTQ
jgi:hypothetical protein